MFELPPQHGRNPDFPPVEEASPEGLLAIGGTLTSDRLLTAYRRGIFPWYNPGQPVLWWSPDPRTILRPDRIKVSRSTRKLIRRDRFRITMDQRFYDVIQGCASTRSQNPSAGTGITTDMINSYCRLHALGYAHSVETWDGDRLVGGLYGVSLGRVFFGESMFSYESSASKLALIRLADQLAAWGFETIDCQLPSLHMFSLGAEQIPRARFITILTTALGYPDRCGPWSFDDTVFAVR